ncbi:MAG: hypothetical protein LN590_06960 [Rickettsia endosymbiont of Glossina mortisans submortisans]|nr:hypothetical protein [Rickettsia endosymbiont of Glossina mortisans submortisans]
MRGKTASFDEVISGCLTRLPRRFAPRNDGLGVHATKPSQSRNDDEV